MCALAAGSASLSLTKQNRAWRTNIESPKKQTPVLTVHREIVGTDQDSNIVTREAAGTTHRVIDAAFLSDTKNQVTLADGTVLTAAEVFEALPLFFDKFAQQDIDADAARLKAIEDAKKAAETPATS